VFTFNQFVAAARDEDLRRDARRATRRAEARRSAPDAGLDLPMTIRPAYPDDAVALAGLAARSARRVPAPPVLLGEAAGRLRAAVSLSDGATIADPAYPTAVLLQLLVARAAQVRREARTARRRRGR
jgi:hypothetical protein